MSQQILDNFWTNICLFQSVRANQSSISVKYAPKECRKKDIRRVYYLWIYRCLKQSTFHYQLTFICMYWALGEKWKAKELSEGVWWIFSRTCLLWRHNFPRRDERKIFPSCHATHNGVTWFLKFVFDRGISLHDRKEFCQINLIKSIKSNQINLIKSISSNHFLSNQF